jgi:hypothetical protein
MRFRNEAAPGFLTSACGFERLIDVWLLSLRPENAGFALIRGKSGRRNSGVSALRHSSRQIEVFDCEWIA